MKLILPYQNFGHFKNFCQTKQIKIIKIEFVEMICCTIQMSLDEKEKIMNEMEEKQFNIQNIEIIKNKNIRKNIEK